MGGYYWVAHEEGKEKKVAGLDHAEPSIEGWVLLWLVTGRPPQSFLFGSFLFYFYFYFFYSPSLCLRCLRIRSVRRPAHGESSLADTLPKERIEGKGSRQEKNR